MTRPAHLSAPLVAVVALGGALGTALRYATTAQLGAPGGWPVGTLVENLLGAFLLGALLEVLVRRGDESRRGTLVRLALGTGVLGGFTTFSSLAIELERLLADGTVVQAVAYATVSVVAGVTAAFAGVVVGARHHRWRRDRAQPGAEAPAPRPQRAAPEASGRTPPVPTREEPPR
ncbi:CrcB family protein [Cellulomonas sp. APG4]|uniref:fluoride efflux transporter FluC n=1 Tax=Cellulomonas sp. APG4 TaxID=1538656 RepID=UPI00137A5E37|nr:CrcB family protein [Cellulomonas sp. APG4]NCT89374.1 CrcB family protein [Cellulomonas sp. APG4]